jgi:hypothetical protein
MVTQRIDSIIFVFVSNTDRLDNVAKENQRLSEKMEEIMTHPPRFLDDKNSAVAKKSLNMGARRREQEKIEAENKVK